MIEPRGHLPGHVLLGIGRHVAAVGIERQPSLEPREIA